MSYFKVKLITAKNSNSMLRQTVGSSGVSHCGKYKFYIDDEVDDPDFIVVRNKYLKGTQAFAVSKKNTILMISEPYTVVEFPAKYAKQFGLYHSCQLNVNHPNVVYGPPALSWFIGKIFDNNGTHSITYDKLKRESLPDKTKLISVITSSKAFSKGHQKRIDFVAKLKERYGDMIDVYGRGINDFKDKWDVLAPYKYHIVIENSQSDHYWTEKLSDCYLAGTYPIYYGCTNVESYFPEDGVTIIDIDDFEKSFETIDKVIADDVYQSKIDVLTHCRDLVLDDYNIFTLIANCCDKLDSYSKKDGVTLHKAVTFLNFHNIKLYVFERNFFLLKNWLKKLLGVNDVLRF